MGRLRLGAAMILLCLGNPMWSVCKEDALSSKVKVTACKLCDPLHLQGDQCLICIQSNPIEVDHDYFSLTVAELIL